MRAAKVGPSRQFWSDRRVLVVGNTGSKGAWLSLWPHRLGEQVYGLSLPPPTTPSLYALADPSALVPTAVVDIRGAADLCDALRDQRPEFVFHVAAQRWCGPGRHLLCEQRFGHAARARGSPHRTERALRGRGDQR